MRPTKKRHLNPVVRVAGARLTQPLDIESTLNDNESVLARIGHWLLIVALLGATGAHWAMLQSVAWARMLAENVKTESFEEAISKTFDGKHPCALCKQIAKGRKADKTPAAQTEIRKLEFPAHCTAFIFNSPVDFRLAGNFIATAPLLTQPPAVPPPRIFAA